VLKTLEKRNILIRLSLWVILSLAIFLPSFLDNASLTNSVGTTRSALFLILIPGAFIGIAVFQIRQLFSAIVIGSAVLISLIIPIHAFFSILGISWVLTAGLSIISFYFLLRAKKYLFTNDLSQKIELSLQNLVIIIFSIIIFILLFRQSLYVPSNSLDQFLVWPDTYNAIAQAGEITNHGPSIFPFVADAQIPLKYHWGAFSLGSFISFFGSFELIVSIFKTQFILLGILYFGLLYLAGKAIGKSWIAGVFSLILGGLTIYPTFPEFNDQIGLARPFISSTSMPQFTANVFAILAIYFIYSYNQIKINIFVKILSLFFVTLAATLSKGPVGLLIVMLAITYLVLNYKTDLKKNTINLLVPSVVGFIAGYSQVSSSSSSEGRNGTSLWFNPLDTFKLLTDGYGLTLNSRSLNIFVILFVMSFSSLIFVTIHTFHQKTLNLFIPLVITILAGIGGTLLLETWGDSQLFLLYSVIPFIGVLLASVAFYKETELKTDKILLITLGLLGQPVLFALFSSFVPRAQVLRTFTLWAIATVFVFLITVVIAKIKQKSVFAYLLTVSLSIGMFSGLTKFDQKAYSLPEHPYSISVGTYEIANYLKKESNKNDLIATNRHCAGLEENQTCTARQFALSALSERRVFLEGWSYTTCPLAEPILNKYWKEDSWKVNQDFFISPTTENFEILRKSGVDWLVVDITRPSLSNYEPFAELVKTSGNVSLWQVTEPYLGEVLKQSDPCGPKSVQITNQ
jgi:hypothetical protein